MLNVMRKVISIEFVGGPRDGLIDEWPIDKVLPAAPAIVEDTITRSRYGRRGMKPTHTAIAKGKIAEHWFYDYEGRLDVGSNQ